MEVTIDIKEIKILKKKIINLTKKEQIEVFKIIREKKENYSENRNGVFINMNNLDKEIIKKISFFVDFCHENKIKMDIDNQFIQNLKKDLKMKTTTDLSENIKKNEIEYIYNEKKELYNLNNLEKEILKFSLKKEKAKNIQEKKSIII
jgi:hypothetical protein